MTRDPWMPDRSLQERLARAVDSMIPGTGRGRVAQAMQVPSRGSTNVESLDDDMTPDLSFSWSWSDRLVVTTAGAQTTSLSNEPMDQSLQVYWHPNGLSKAPLRWPSENFSNQGSLVTILDPDSIIEVDDAFSFHYTYLIEGDEQLLGSYFIDTRSSSVVVGPYLDAGTSYRLEVYGTYTLQPSVVYGQTVPLIYSSGGVGFASFDAEWVYGVQTPSGSYPAKLDAVDPSDHLQWRHGSGGSWHNWTATTSSPDGNYTYSRRITGQGAKLQLWFADTPRTDNDGKLRVQVFK